jgi:hypothetical protein
VAQHHEVPAGISRLQEVAPRVIDHQMIIGVIARWTCAATAIVKFLEIDHGEVSRRNVGWCSPVVAQQEILGEGVIDVGAELLEVDVGQPARCGAGLRPGGQTASCQRPSATRAQTPRPADPGQPVDELVHRFVVMRCGHGRRLLAHPPADPIVAPVLWLAMTRDRSIGA